MTWYTRIQGFYEKGYWNKAMVGDGVIAKVITEAEYKEITGDDYNAAQ
ncbi:XkdX family protein [Bacillus infantis]